MSFIRKSIKEKRWICSCRRINGEDELICGFCQQPRDNKDLVVKKAKQGRPKAYDDIVLAPIFGLFIRLRDSDKNGICRCFTCGAIKRYNRGDCGHGAGRQHKGTKYNEMNNHFQCKKCNGFEGGAREKYKVAMDKKYGPRTWDKMEIASRGVFKLGKTEIDFLASHYTKEVERLKLEKGL